MAKKAEPIVTLGLTKRMMEEIRARKLSNDLEFILANRAGEMKDKFFNKDYADYKIPMHERMHYHVAMELRLYDQSNGSRESVPQVQIFEPNVWRDFKASDVFKTYIAEFVHNPELEEKDAPLVTLKYTLTDEELAEQNKIEEASQQLTPNPNDLPKGTGVAPDDEDKSIKAEGKGKK